MFSSRELAGVFTTALLFASVSAQIDIEAVALAGPPPTPSIAVNVASQVIEYDHNAVEAAAAAEQSSEAAQNDDDLRRRWSDCDPQVLGKGPLPTPDTVEAFQKLKALSDAANNAPTPLGYKNTYKNLNASANALGYLGFTTLDKYDSLLCAKKCDAKDGCAAININFERAPSLDPSPPDGKCPQPPSTNLIKCVFWGGPVNIGNAVNDGSWREKFHVIAAGSNGYVNYTIDDAPGYTSPRPLSGNILNPPNNCKNESTLVGYQYWNDGKPFDSRRCAAACSAQLSADPSNPCYFFNTYVVNKNDRPQGQYCALYSQQWSESDGQQSVTMLNGDKYTYSYSYTLSNSTSNGLPCLKSASTSSTSNPVATPSATPLKCPASNGTTYVSNGKTFLIECGKDYQGNNLQTVSVGAGNLNACVDTCASTAGCVDASLSGAACYLKKALGNQVSNSAWNARLLASPSGAATTTTAPTTSSSSSVASIISSTTSLSTALGTTITSGSSSSTTPNQASSTSLSTSDATISTTSFSESSSSSSSWTTSTSSTPSTQTSSQISTTFPAAVQSTTTSSQASTSTSSPPLQSTSSTSEKTVAASDQSLSSSSLSRSSQDTTSSQNTTSASTQLSSEQSFTTSTSSQLTTALELSTSSSTTSTSALSVAQSIATNTTSTGVQSTVSTQISPSDSSSPQQTSTSTTTSQETLTPTSLSSSEGGSETTTSSLEVQSTTTSTQVSPTTDLLQQSPSTQTPTSQEAITPASSSSSTKAQETTTTSAESNDSSLSSSTTLESTTSSSSGTSSELSIPSSETLSKVFNSTPTSDTTGSPSLISSTQSITSDETTFSSTSAVDTTTQSATSSSTTSEDATSASTSLTTMYSTDAASESTIEASTTSTEPTLDLSTSTTTSSTSVDTCSPTFPPGQQLSPPACDPIFTLEGATENGVSPAGSAFSFQIACGSLNKSSVAIFLSGMELPAADYIVNDASIDLNNGVYGPATITVMALNLQGYPLISSFDVVFGAVSLSVSVTGASGNPLYNCEIVMTGSDGVRFSLTKQTDEYTSGAIFENLPYTTVDLKATCQGGQVASNTGVWTGNGFEQLRVLAFDDSTQNLDFSDGTSEGWLGDGAVFIQDQYPILETNVPPPLPWLPWGCNSPDYFFGCFCFEFNDFFCGLDWYCEDGNLCLPYLPCCLPVLLKRDDDAGNTSLTLSVRQTASQTNDSSNASYASVSNMTEFISKLSDTVKVFNGSEIVDASLAQQKNISTLLTTISQNETITPPTNITDAPPVTNITERIIIPTPDAITTRSENYDLFVVTKGLWPTNTIATFNVDSTVTTVFIRYKFMTSELQRPFGASRDDSFTLNISSDRGDAVRKRGSVNSIRYGNNNPGGPHGFIEPIALRRRGFDFSGATEWLELRMRLSPGATKVKFEITVQNDLDSEFDSAIVIDRVGTSQDGSTCNQACEDMRPGSCDFYAKCMEATVPCQGSTSSYALDFGEQNCKRYTEDNLSFGLSGQGRAFAQGAIQCVQGGIQSHLNCESTCPDLKQTAFGLYQDCYIDNGFCTGGLTCKDYATALMTVGHETTMFNTLRQVALAGPDCAYGIKTAMDACYDWQLSNAARDVVWAAYFGTSYSSTKDYDFYPCQAPPTGTPGPIQNPPPPQETSEPLPTPGPAPPQQLLACENVGQCYTYSDCGAGNSQGDSCVCGTDVDGNSACFRGATPCLGQDCSSNSDCAADSICLNTNSCCGYPVCVKVNVCDNPLYPIDLLRRGSEKRGGMWTAVHRPKGRRWDRRERVE